MYNKTNSQKNSMTKLFCIVNIQVVIVVLILMILIIIIIINRRLFSLRHNSLKRRRMSVVVVVKRVVFTHWGANSWWLQIGVLAHSIGRDNRWWLDNKGSLVVVNSVYVLIRIDHFYMWGWRLRRWHGVWRRHDHNVRYRVIRARIVLVVLVVCRGCWDGRCCFETVDDVRWYGLLFVGRWGCWGECRRGVAVRSNRVCWWWRRCGFCRQLSW